MEEEEEGPKNKVGKVKLPANAPSTFRAGLAFTQCAYEKSLIKGSYEVIIGVPFSN